MANSDTYTIDEIQKDEDGNLTGNVVVTFDVDGKQQVIAGAPLDDDEALKLFLSNYLVAYKAGLEVEAVSVDGSVTSLVGHQQTVTVEA